MSLEEGDEAAVPHEVEVELRRPLAPPPSRPTVAALGVCAFADLLLTCLLSAMRVGGAISWDWGWVLAPVWVPLAIATIGVVLLGLVLAAMDERDAARRRAS